MGPDSVDRRRLLRLAGACGGASPLVRRCFLWLAGVLLLAAAHATAGEVRVGDAPRHELWRAFTSLEDPHGRLTLDDILAAPQQADFRPVAQHGHGANFGFTPSAIWLRVTLKLAPATPEEWLLELAYPPLDRVELYAPDPMSGEYRRQVGGDLQPFAGRALPHRNHVLPLTLRAGADSTLYLRLTSQGAVIAPVTLWRPAALWQHDQAGYGALSLYFGLLLGLLLYNLLLFVSVRDVGYLIYVGFVAAMATGQAALTGLGLQFVWPDWAWLNNVMPAVSLSAAAVFGLMFGRHFLSSASRMPRVDRFMRMQLAAWTMTLLAALVLPYSITARAVTSLAVVSVATGVVLGVESIRRRFAGARLFFLAWAVLLCGVLTLALHNSGVLPSNALTANSLLIGSALEMVLLSFALADRINVARRFKEKAQARIAAEHAMVEAMGQAHEQLQLLLHEREAILNSLPLGILLAVDQRAQWVNLAFARMLGYPADVLIGQPSSGIHVDEASWERCRAEAAAVLRERGVYDCEHQLKRSSGEPLWARMSATCVAARHPEQGVVWTVVEFSPGGTSRPLAAARAATVQASG
jgi:PAS domain S-box-containing protein